MSGFGWRFFSVSFHSFLFYGVFIYRPTRFLPSSLLLYPFFTFISLSEYSSHQVQFHQSPARYATGTKWKCNILRTRNCFIISFIRITAKQNASAVHYKLTNEFHDTGSASTVGNAFTHKEMTCLYEKRRLITVFTKATVRPYRQPVQSLHPSTLHFSIILPSSHIYSLSHWQSLTVKNPVMNTSSITKAVMQQLRVQRRGLSC